MRKLNDLSLMIMDDLQFFIPLWIFVGIIYFIPTTPLILASGATIIMLIANLLKWGFIK